MSSKPAVPESTESADATARTSPIGWNGPVGRDWLGGAVLAGALAMLVPLAMRAVVNSEEAAWTPEHTLVALAWFICGLGATWATSSGLVGGFLRPTRFALRPMYLVTNVPRFARLWPLWLAVVAVPFFTTCGLKSIGEFSQGFGSLSISVGIIGLVHLVRIALSARLLRIRYGRVAVRRMFGAWRSVLDAWALVDGRLLVQTPEAGEVIAPVHWNESTEASKALARAIRASVVNYRPVQVGTSYRSGPRVEMVVASSPDEDELACEAYEAELAAYREAGGERKRNVL